MGLLSFLHKNKQESKAEAREFHSRAEEESNAVRGRAKRGAGNAGASREAMDPVLPEKKRARRRLIGAFAIVLAVIVGLPMVLDSEPKPLAGDVSIQIPPRDKPFSASGNAASSKVAAADALDSSEEIVDTANAAVKPTPSPTSTPAIASNSAAKPSAAHPLPTPSPKPIAAEKKAKPIEVATLDTATSEAAAKPVREEAKAKPVERKVENKPDSKATVKPEGKSEHKQELKPEKATLEPSKPEQRRAARSEEAMDDAARANAILEGKPIEQTPHHAAAKPESEAKAAKAESKPQKIVLQVAALASQEKVDELQGKLREAGIKSFAQKVSTSNGEKTRVRIGPFADKEEADRMRAKLQALGLNGSVVP